MKTRLTEMDITRIVKRVLKESDEKTYRVECEGCRLPSKLEMLADGEKLTGTFKINSDRRTMSYKSDNVWLDVRDKSADNYFTVLQNNLKERCQPLLQKHYDYMVKKVSKERGEMDAFFSSDDWKSIGPLCLDYETILSIIEDNENPLGL
jgi:hypothetical protein